MHAIACMIEIVGDMQADFMQPGENKLYIRPIVDIMQTDQ